MNDNDLSLEIALIPDRIKRGVEFCDNTYGEDWPHRINLTTFNIRMSPHCVIGELDGDYYAGCRAHDLSYGDDAEDLGFTHRQGDDEVWEALDSSWRTTIEDLQNSRPKP